MQPLRRPWFARPARCAIAFTLAAIALPAMIVSAPTPASAAASAYVSWSICSCSRPPDPHEYDLAVAPGSVPGFGVALSGLARPYAGFDVAFEIGPMDDGPFPDAWRFDDGGCQGGDAMNAVDLPAACESFCRPIVPPGATAGDQVYTRTWDPDRGVVRVGYSIHWNAAFPDPDPSEWYFVCGFGFSHANSVIGGSTGGACGGVERPMCFRLVHVEMFDAAGARLALPVDQPTLSANGSGGAGAAGCMSVPARGPTWGTVKGQYR